ncbi:MAG: DUF4350 domain-containing protein [Planctomycetota bacterium]|jgi:hypothetical protein
MVRSLCCLVLLVATSLGAARAETILLDGIHAHNRTERGLAPGVHDYHDLHGPRWALQRLERRGHTIREVREGRLDAAALDGVNVLYVNLVSSDLPAFFPEEIAAVHGYVERGGSLLLITDHSNCYHHVNKLEPLAEALGLRLWRESALETPPRGLGAGPGWIVVDHFEEHPITRGLRWISFQTGGPVDDRWAVATLSDGGWGDAWETAPYGENALRRGNLGNYGNFERDEGERTGRLGVVAARELGQGRIVVVGDQNVFGDLWIRYGDNRRLFENVMAWLLRASPGGGAPREAEGPRVLLLEDRARMAFGSDADEGLYRAFVALGRHVDVVAHDRMDGAFDLVVVAPRATPLDAELAARLADHVQAGRVVLWLGRRGAAGRQGRAALKALLAQVVVVESATPDDGVEHRIHGGGRILEMLQAQRFDNRALAEPTETPDAAQQAAAEAWIRSILALLPPR